MTNNETRERFDSFLPRFENLWRSLAKSDKQVLQEINSFPVSQNDIKQINNQVTNLDVQGKENLPPFVGDMPKKGDKQVLQEINLLSVKPELELPTNSSGGKRLNDESQNGIKQINNQVTNLDVQGKENLPQFVGDMPKNVAPRVQSFLPAILNKEHMQMCCIFADCHGQCTTPIMDSDVLETKDDLEEVAETQLSSSRNTSFSSQSTNTSSATDSSGGSTVIKFDLSHLTLENRKKKILSPNDNSGVHFGNDDNIARISSPATNSSFVSSIRLELPQQDTVDEGLDDIDYSVVKHKNDINIEDLNKLSDSSEEEWEEGHFSSKFIVGNSGIVSSDESSLGETAPGRNSFLAESQSSSSNSASLSSQSANTSSSTDSSGSTVMKFDLSHLTLESHKKKGRSPNDIFDNHSDNDDNILGFSNPVISSNSSSVPAIPFDFDDTLSQNGLDNITHAKEIKSDTSNRYLDDIGKAYNKDNFSSKHSIRTENVSSGELSLGDIGSSSEFSLKSIKCSSDQFPNRRNGEHLIEKEAYTQKSPKTPLTSTVLVYNIDESQDSCQIVNVKSPVIKDRRKKVNSTKSSLKKTNGVMSFVKIREKITKESFNEFNSKVFKGSLKDVEVLWSKRLNKTAGLTRLKSLTKGGLKKRFAEIELSVKVIDNEERLRSTLMHEMCHAAAWLLDGVHKPPHGKIWQQYATLAMRKVTGMSVSTTHNYAIAYKYAWACTNPECDVIIKRHSRSINIQKQCCAKCEGRLIEIEVSNKKSISGSLQNNYTPKKKREATGFSLFVKENSANIRARLISSDRAINQADVMKACSRIWKEKKNLEANSKKELTIDGLDILLGSLTLQDL